MSSEVIAKLILCAKKVVNRHDAGLLSGAGDSQAIDKLREAIAHAESLPKAENLGLPVWPEEPGMREVDAIFEEAANGCQCRKCIGLVDASLCGSGLLRTFPTMIVCEKCGNKRCPHANDHSNECTGSNEPGQKGSAYE